MSQKQARDAHNARNGRNRRKKEGAKTRKAEAKQKDAEEDELLDTLKAMALEERKQDSLNKSRLEDWIEETAEEINAMGSGTGTTLQDRDSEYPSI